MSLSSLSKVYLPAIEKELRAVVDSAFTADYHELRLMLAYHLGWEGQNAGLEAQGKRIRPLLLLLCAGAAGAGAAPRNPAAPWENALPAAAAVELLHNFSLIHDDIQDHSPTRRGRPTVWMEWGIPQAINAGDTMFSLAQIAMLNLCERVSDQTALKASLLLNQTCVALTEGQFLDISYEKETAITLDAYWPMITGKTAALLSACATLGALIGGASPQAQAAFHDFGHFLGLAFQAQDDLLGLWGDHEQIGKSITSDLVSGKKSLPVLYGLSQHSAFSQRWLAGPIQAEEAPAVAQLLEKEGAKTYTQQMTNTLTQQSLKALETALPVQEENGLALFELAHSLLNRSS
jgi:geranylgeranyl diphosphate synthase type I